MGKINDLLKEMRKHTSTYPNIMAIAIVVANLIYLESIIVSEYVIKPHVEPENYSIFDSISLWVHFLILYPLIMKFFGMEFHILRNFKSLFKRN
ncbi:hypothetical protein ACLD9W_07670 [Neisseria sp. WLZKY-1]|jgi:hypothetical protein|uniref:hypothetical protein n=1 Tax=Neisseria sp. WLZKY-1 TaxID=3390377 RepID=UPI00397AC207